MNTDILHNFYNSNCLTCSILMSGAVCDVIQLAAWDSQHCPTAFSYEQPLKKLIVFRKFQISFRFRHVQLFWKENFKNSSNFQFSKVCLIFNQLFDKLLPQAILQLKIGISTIALTNVVFTTVLLNVKKVVLLHYCRGRLLWS